MLDVMVSSTVRDLGPERQSAVDLIQQIPFLRPIGSEPIGFDPEPASSFVATRRMAKECDLYVLILGPSYGHESNGVSATEGEYRAATSEDPTKVLALLLSNEVPVEEKQQRFVDSVRSYDVGYVVPRFRTVEELRERLGRGIESWLTARSGRSPATSIEFQFIREALRGWPRPESGILYSVEDQDIIFRRRDSGGLHITIVRRDEVTRDFWGQLAAVHDQVSRWV